MGVLDYFKRRKNKEPETEEVIVQQPIMQPSSALYNNLKELGEDLLDAVWNKTYDSVEEYLRSDDFESLVAKQRLLSMLEMEELQYLQKKDKELFHLSYLAIKNRMREIVARKKELDIAASQLETVRAPLANEIINFTNIVREVGERYKLSPNWEGKKPVLIEKQKELEKRKDEYEKNEKQLDRCFVAFYKEYKAFDQEFRELCKRIP
ncbi:MAG: hypothetical protein R3Y58_06915 [Eubacteriales bacterium]